MAFVAVGQHCNPPVGFGARDAAIAGFAHDQPELRVKQQAVGPARGFPEDLDVPARIAARDTVLTSEVQASAGMPGGAFAGSDRAQVGWRIRCLKLERDQQDYPGYE